MFPVCNSQGAFSLLTDGKRAIGSDNWKCSDSYNITTYGTASSNEWHASSIRPNLRGGSDYTLVCKDGFLSGRDAPLLPTLFSFFWKKWCMKLN